MLNIDEYLKAFRRAKSLTDAIPAQSFSGDHCLLNKSGSVLVGFSVDKPLDSECMPNAEMQYIRGRLMSAHALFDLTTRHHQYLIRNRSATIPVSPDGSNIDRVRFLRDNAQCGSVEQFQFIEALVPFSAKVRAKLQPQDRQRWLHKTMRDLAITARAYSLQCEDLFAPQLLTKYEVFNFLRRILNIGSHWAQGIDLRSDLKVDEQLKNHSIRWDANHECLRVGRRFVRVYSLLDFPDFTIPNLWRDLLSLDVDLIAHSSWQALDRVAVTAEVRTMQRVVYNLERANSSIDKRAQVDASVYDLMGGGADEKLRQLNEVLRNQRGTEGKYAGFYGLTVAVHSHSAEDLQSQCEKVENVFKLKQAILHEEDGAPVFGCVLPVYFSMLPGNGALALRGDLKLENHHYSDMSMVWGSEAGTAGNDYANIYETRASSLFYSATHYEEVAGECVTGKTRSGKSVYMQDRISALLPKVSHTVIFDVGESYSTLVALNGGSIVRFSADAMGEKLWPFQKELTPSHLEFLKDFVRLLIESHGFKMRADDDRNDMRVLEARIAGLYRMEPEQRTLTNLMDALQGEMKAELRRWCKKSAINPKGGQYGMFFDHNEDTLSISHLQLFEFERVKPNQAPPPYFEPLMMLLTHRIDETVTDPGRLDQLKHVVMDEAGVQLKRETTASFVVSALKTWQKKNCMISIVTQSPSDFGALAPFVLESCSSFIYFTNPQVSPKLLIERDGFDEKKVEVFLSLRPREFLLHARGQAGSRDTWKVCKLTLDAERRAAYSTTPADQKRRNELVALVGAKEAVKQLAAAAS